MGLLNNDKVKRTINISKWLTKQGKSIILPIIIISLIGSFAAVVGVGMAVVSKYMVDAAVARNASKVFKLAAFFGIIMLVQTGLDILSNVLSLKSGEKVANALRIRIFRHWTKAEWSQISKYHSGDILTRMTSDVGTVTGGFIGLLPGIISLGVKLITSFIALMIFQPRLAILTFILTPATLLFSRVFAGRLGRLHKRIQEAESKYRSHMQESIQNIMIIKTFQSGETSVDRINSLQNQRLHYIMKRNWLGIFTGLILQFGYLGGYAIAFIWCVIGISNGSMTFGTMTAFLQLISQIQSPFMGLAKSIPQMIAVAASSERIMELEKLELEEEANDYLVYEKAGINLNKVSFNYDLEKNILHNLSLTIDSGETIGLIGSSGEGKTTLIRLLLALIKPSEGEITFNNLDESTTASASTRSIISYVPQGNTLFSGTIEDNIRIGNNTAGFDALLMASKVAYAVEFIENLPNKFNTIVGERGYGLSEGQAQRIAIARAILRNTPILILDEATSALDSDTEVKVLSEIKALTPSKTCILITHRKSALSICDRVLKLDSGMLNEIKI